MKTSIEFFLVYQQILNVLKKKHMVNDNWLQLKSGKKCRLGVNFFMCSHQFIMCEKIVIDGMHWSHNCEYRINIFLIH
jgi:hypothetical protein